MSTAKTSAKRTAKKTAKRSAERRAKPPSHTAHASAPPPAAAPPVDVKELVRAAVAAEVAAALMAQPAPTPAPVAPFGVRRRKLTEQTQVRYTDLERQLYERAGVAPSICEGGEPLPRYEIMRRLAWEGARALGLLASLSASGEATPAAG